MIIVSTLEVGASYADLQGTNTRSGMSCNAVEVALLSAGEKMAPFFDSKLANRSARIICVADYDESTLTCNFDALAAVAST